MSVRSIIARAQLRYRGASRRRDIRLGRPTPTADRKEVITVLSVQRLPGCQVLVCREDETDERFRLILAREQETIEVGDVGIITGRAGEHGYHWEWTKAVRT